MRAQGLQVYHGWRKPKVSTYRASLASLLRLTKGESLLSIARGYEVTHEGARLASLLWVRGGRKSLLSAWDEVLRERAQTFGRRLVAREEVKSATTFYALFVRENTQF